jgi:DNA-binding response OmpR family regulator
MLTIGPVVWAILSWFRAVDHPAMTTPNRPETTPPKNVRVLFVDDEEPLRFIAAECLDMPGCTVETASDGLEAWAKLEAREFDVLITDLDMPNLDGIGLIRRVRTSRLPVRIIVHSSALTPRHVIDLHELAVDAAIEKVHTVTELRGTVKSVLDRDC